MHTLPPRMHVLKFYPLSQSSFISMLSIFNWFQVCPFFWFSSSKNSTPNTYTHNTQTHFHFDIPIIVRTTHQRQTLTFLQDLQFNASFARLDLIQRNSTFVYSSYWIDVMSTDCPIPSCHFAHAVATSGQINVCNLPIAPSRHFRIATKVDRTSCF